MGKANGGSVKSGADPVSEFFAVLAEPGHLATFEGQSATLRLDVMDGVETEHWYVTVTDGDVAVSRDNAPADAIVCVQRPEAEGLVTGRLNAQAAFLRGLLTVDGSVAAVIMFQRCLPGPPGSTGRVAPISSKTVTEQGRAA